MRDQAVSMSTRSVRHRFQFRISSLMLITLVAALCGALLHVALPVGLFAMAPMTAALMLTFRGSPQREGALTLQYFRSLGVIVALMVTSLMTLVASAIVCLLYVFYQASRLARLVAFFVRDSVPVRPRAMRLVVRVGAACSDYVRTLFTLLLSWMIRLSRRLFSASGVLGRISVDGNRDARPALHG